MLSAPYRLRRSHEITRVYRRGRYGNGGVLSLKALATGGPVARATVVVSKKTAKRAVKRNRMRRRTVEQLREQWATVRPGYDIVITIHQDLTEVPVAVIARALAQALAGSGASHRNLT